MAASLLAQQRGKWSWVGHQLRSPIPDLACERTWIRGPGTFCTLVLACYARYASTVCSAPLIPARRGGGGHGGAYHESADHDQTLAGEAVVLFGLRVHVVRIEGQPVSTGRQRETSTWVDEQLTVPLCIVHLWC